MFTPQDRHWMELALTLAEKAKGYASPNPMVGAVVVKDDQLISQGWHEGPGKPHAEAVALNRAGKDARGATLYVTLEPCSHWGRTPPCTQQVIASGIQRVIAAVQDPNPQVSGTGMKQLEDAGIQVMVGLLENRARLLNREYFTWRTCQRPYVHAKIAQSLDGKVATRTGHSQWITSEASRTDGHMLRAHVDAIVVGVGTVLADDPLLTARPAGQQERYPLRVICDSSGRTPSDARCLSAPGKTVIATTPTAPQDALDALANAGAAVWVDTKSDGRIDLRRLLALLADDYQITSLLVEGGPTMIGAFRDADLIDELHLYTAPFIIGGREALSSVAGVGVDTLASISPLVDRKWIPIQQDMKFTGRVWREHLDGLGGN